MSEIGGIFNAPNANAKNVSPDEIKKSCFEKYCTDFQLNHIENWQKKRKKIRKMKSLFNYSKFYGSLFINLTGYLKAFVLLELLD